MSTGSNVAKREDVSVKIAAATYRKLRTVASWKGEHLAEYLTNLVDPILDRELERMAKQFPSSKKPTDDSP